MQGEYSVRSPVATDILDEMNRIWSTFQWLASNGRQEDGLGELLCCWLLFSHRLALCLSV
jgi:hypothetical protein